MMSPKSFWDKIEKKTSKNLFIETKFSDENACHFNMKNPINTEFDPYVRNFLCLMLGRALVGRETMWKFSKNLFS